MASIADLRGLLHQQAWALFDGAKVLEEPVGMDAQVRSWAAVASHAARALVPLGIAPELEATLAELAAGAHPTPDRSDAKLDELARTLGALADLIDAGRDAVEWAGVPARSRLQLSIQAAVHAAALASLPLGNAPSRIRARLALTRLADLTEPAALIPPSARESILDYLRPAEPAPTTVVGATRQWSRVADLALRNPELVTGYTLQRTSTSIALVCATTATVIGRAARRGLMEPGFGERAADALLVASRAWKEAAAWSPRWRLGGRSPDLRLAASDLDAALRGTTLSALPMAEQLGAVWLAVHTAGRIGRLNHTVLTALNQKGSFWLAVSTLPEAYLDQNPGTRRNAWVLQRTQDFVDADAMVARTRTATRVLARSTATLDVAIEQQTSARSGSLALNAGGISAYPIWESARARAPQRRDRRTASDNMPTLPGIGL